MTEARFNISNSRNHPSKALFLRGPALFHEVEEMGQGFLVCFSLFGGQLAGALVELRGHFAGLPGGAAQGNEQRRKVFK
jgi:hypothetical protein